VRADDTHLHVSRRELGVAALMAVMLLVLGVGVVIAGAISVMPRPVVIAGVAAALFGAAGTFFVSAVLAGDTICRSRTATLPSENISA
jgi:hypothetical protein